ncbi:MAG: DUF4258 domain-containing protein [bacterium]
MAHQGGVLTLVRKPAEKKLLFLPHAVRQMSLPERMITGPEVREVVKTGELIEDYPEDARGHSCLILGFGKSARPIHVVCSPKDDYLAIITAYLPDPTEWKDDFRTRKKQ